MADAIVGVQVKSRGQCRVRPSILPTNDLAGVTWVLTGYVLTRDIIAGDRATVCVRINDVTTNASHLYDLCLTAEGTLLPPDRRCARQRRSRRYRWVREGSRALDRDWQIQATTYFRRWEIFTLIIVYFLLSNSDRTLVSDSATKIWKFRIEIIINPIIRIFLILFLQKVCCILDLNTRLMREFAYLIVRCNKFSKRETDKFINSTILQQIIKVEIFWVSKTPQ